MSDESSAPGTSATTGLDVPKLPGWMTEVVGRRTAMDIINFSTAPFDDRLAQNAFMHWCLETARNIARDAVGAKPYWRSINEYASTVAEMLKAERWRIQSFRKHRQIKMAALGAVDMTGLIVGDRISAFVASHVALMAELAEQILTEGAEISEFVRPKMLVDMLRSIVDRCGRLVSLAESDALSNEQRGWEIIEHPIHGTKIWSAWRSVGNAELRPTVGIGARFNKDVREALIAAAISAALAAEK